MPRLRLRVASTGATHKLELPGDCKWEGLQAEARRAVGLPADGEAVVLSLNKKVPLDAPPDAALSSLGVCNGDLVWLLGPKVAAASVEAGPTPSPLADTAPPAAQAIRVPPLAQAAPCTTGAPKPGVGPPPVPASPESTAPGAAADTAAERMSELRAQVGVAEPTAAAAAEATAGGGRWRQPSSGGGGGGEAMEVDVHADGEEAGGAGYAGDDDRERQQHEGRRGVPLKILRLLAPVAGAGSTGAISSSSGNGGGGSTWSSLPASSRCVLLLDCAMEEAGFAGLEDLAALAARGNAFPRQLLYSCPYITGAGGGAAASRAASAAAASTVGRGDGDEPMTEQAASDGGGGGGCDLRTATAAPMAKLIWYGMGRYLVVHGVPYTVGGGSSDASCRLSPVTMHIDLSDYGQCDSTKASNATAAAATTTGLSPMQQQQRILLLPSDPAGHWRRLKDVLVLPLLAAACRAAGTAPPLGLMVLPLELQMAVLRRLEARDLEVLSGVCTALHHLASEDELWRSLYDREFGPLPYADAALASTRGFKFVYGRRWRERAERRKRRQMFRPMAPPPPVWGPPPLAPFARPPFMPPGSIGGDYDRLPAPLLGGGPPSVLGPGGGMLAPGGRGGLAGAFPGLGRRPGQWGGAGSGGLGGGFF